MASQKILEKKQAYVAELSQKIKNSGVGVIISYKGINSKDVTKLRKELRQAEIEYLVVKNTMLKLASEKVGFDFSQYLIGTTAIALSKKDPIQISKILTNYAKKLNDTTEFKIKTGFLDGKIVESKLINEIGSLPTKEQLIGQLLNVLIAPIRGLAISLNETIKKSENSPEKIKKN